MFEDLLHDLRFALRTLKANPGFALVALIALGLGIGANTAVFSVVDAILTFPIPFDQPDRVVVLGTENAELGISNSGASADEILDWEERTTTLAHVVAATQGAYNLGGAGEPTRVIAGRYSGDFWAMAPGAIQRGRGWTAAEARSENARVAVISHGLWQQQFAGDPDVAGRTLLLDGDPYTVVGVADEEFFFPNPAIQLYTPLILERGATSRSQRGLFAFAMLEDGATVEQAQAEMSGIAERLATEYPESNEGWTLRVQTLRDNFNTGAALGMALLYGSITFVLLIACANVANLLLARAASRRQEVSLRASLGAGRLRMFRQLLAESLLLGGIGGLLGIGVAAIGIRLLRGWLAPDPQIGFLARAMELDVSVLLHASLASLVAALLFGMAPAIQLSRGQLVTALREGGRGSSGPARQRLRSGLVLAEVALAIALLGTTGALVRGFDHIYGRDPGFRAEDLITFQLSPTTRDLASEAEVTGFYQEVVGRVGELAGVEAASFTSVLPLTAQPGLATAVAVVPEHGGQRDEQPNALDVVIGPGYLETLEIGLVAGRTFGSQDREDSLAVALVNRTLAERTWSGEAALDRELEIVASDGYRGRVRVVGVIEDIDQTMHSIRESQPMPLLLLPHSQHPLRAMTMVVRSPLEAERVAPQLRRAVWSVDDGQPVHALATMEEVVERVDTQNRFIVGVVTGLAGIALFLAAIGIYGVISYHVAQRRREIGVRIALGVRPAALALSMMRSIGALTLLGGAAGIGLAVVFVRMLGSQLEGIGSTSAGGPMTFVVVALVLVVVAQLASLGPVRRALKVDPVQALRAE